MGRKKRAGRGAGKMWLYACVRTCIHILHSEKQKGEKKEKRSRVMHLEKKCRERWRGWEDTTCHPAGDWGTSGKQRGASRWTGQREAGNWQPTCGQASRQQTPGHLFVNQSAGAWYRAESRWTGRQPGWIPGSGSGVSLSRELATQSHEKGFFLCCLRVVHMV